MARFRVMPSSVIRAFDYDAQARRLRVTFVTGKLYAYLDVPQDIADALRAARSKGEYFNIAIRDQFQFERLRSDRSIRADSTSAVGAKQIPAGDRRWSIRA